MQIRVRPPELEPLGEMGSGTDNPGDSDECCSLGTTDLKHKERKCGSAGQTHLPRVATSHLSIVESAESGGRSRL